MAKKSILLKIEEVDWERWDISAEKAGKTLSAWIRERCNVAEKEPEVFCDSPGIGLPERPVKDVSILERGVVSSELDVVATERGKISFERPSKCRFMPKPGQKCPSCGKEH